LDKLRELFTSYESRNHGSAVRDIPTPEGGSDDVEVEANAYFQQMFSGQISVDAMIQMLSRFKESLDKRYLPDQFEYVLSIGCLTCL
jgi:CCR4-NOT transcription complex subunit 1